MKNDEHYQALPQSYQTSDSVVQVHCHISISSLFFVYSSTYCPRPSCAKLKSSVSNKTMLNDLQNELYYLKYSSNAT
jgi:hypothetical protein